MIKLNRSIDRGLQILEVISDKGPCSLAVLAVQTGLPKATILRICTTMENRRWLIRRSSDGRFQLGSKFPNIGGVSDLASRLVEVAREEIIKLSDETGLGVDLAVAIGKGRVEIVDTTRKYVKHAIYPECIGFRPSPFRSALGASYLFALSADQFSKAMHDLKQNASEKDLVALKQFSKRIQQISDTSYAQREEGHWGRAVDFGEMPSAIGVYIRSGDEPIGSINLVWAAKDFAVDTIVEMHLSKLKSTASVIGKNVNVF